MQGKRRQLQQQQPTQSSISSAPPPLPHHHHHHHHHHHPHHLQPVQDDDLRRLHLPPSIPVSRDGEEGAAVYNLRLQQSNCDAKPDCYQAPPNRTVLPADPLLVAAASSSPSSVVSSAASAGGGGPGVLSHHSTSTPSLKRVGAISPTQLLFLDASKFRSTKQQQQQQGSRALPQQPTRLAEPHRQHLVVADYVSGSLLSTWRAMSPDRWKLSTAGAKKKSIIPIGGDGASGGGGLPLPPYPGHLPGGGATPSPAEDDPTTGSKRPAAVGPKQRSSSADSVRRLVARCSLLRFARKQTTKTPKASTSGGLPLAIDADRKQFDEQLDEDDGGQTTPAEEEAKDDEGAAPPWELPPNYVDMIFTKEPPPAATVDPEKKDNVIKQQQHQEKQQRQQQHCCFNS